MMLQRGRSLHRVAHVVVDDGRVGVDGRLQDVGVDVGGFACLTHLNVYVFNHVGIEFVDVQLKFQQSNISLPRMEVAK